MRCFQFSEEQLAAIREQRLSHPVVRVREKLDVLSLKAAGLKHQKIAAVAGVSRRTVQRYLDEYWHAGLDATVTVKSVPPKSVLHQHKALLEDHFNEHPPATVAQAQADIERLTGIRRGPTQTREFLKKGSIFVGARRDPCRPRPIPTLKIGF